MRDAGFYLETHGLELFRHDLAGAKFAIRQFGIGVEIAAPRNHLLAAFVHRFLHGLRRHGPRDTAAGDQ